jgi:hypothetical protein
MDMELYMKWAGAELVHYDVDPRRPAAFGMGSMTEGRSGRIPAMATTSLILAEAP